jgi:nicotinamide riboside kinase
LNIRSAPILGVARLLDQIHQPVLALGIVAVVHLVGVECGFEGRNLRLRRRDLRLFRAIREAWQDDSRQDAQDHQHQQQFHQGEPLLAALGDSFLCELSCLYFHSYSHS